ncbi:MAG TPA: phosphotransferase [Candidatus Limnocylindria bacterium]|nr:phosphotransferase [Candidatus Limnocylindria bacterium]
MLLPDPSIDVASLAHLLATEFGADDLTPTFVPVGGDSWSYRAGPWWVSVRRDRQGHFPENYEAARELRDAGYEFVLAPIRGRSGHVVHEVRGRPVVVTEFVESRANYREGLAPVHRQELAQAVNELHSARVSADVGSESFDLPFADELEGALARAAAGSHAAGPLGSDVSDLVSRNAARIADWREEIAVCQERCRASPGELVLTHGEPEPPNVLITPDDELLLLDWGDLLRAPPERDALSRRKLGIAPPARRDFLRFYELRWILSEVAEYVSRFTSPHEGNAEDLEKRGELARYLD